MVVSLSVSKKRTPSKLPGYPKPKLQRDTYDHSRGKANPGAKGRLGPQVASVVGARAPSEVLAILSCLRDVRVSHIVLDNHEAR